MYSARGAHAGAGLVIEEVGEEVEDDRVLICAPGGVLVGVRRLHLPDGRWSQGPPVKSG